MKLSTAGISILRGNKPLWQKARAALKVSIPSMYRYVADNDEVLTQASVLKVIREETGLTDQEILEEEKATALVQK
jgi:hypothetical protein